MPACKSLKPDRSASWVHHSFLRGDWEKRNMRAGRRGRLHREYTSESGTDSGFRWKQLPVWQLKWHTHTYAKLSTIAVNDSFPTPIAQEDRAAQCNERSWFSSVKTLADSECCGKSEHAGSWAGVGSLKPGCSAPWLCYFILRALLREEKWESRAAFIEGGQRAEKSETRTLNESIPSPWACSLCIQSVPRQATRSLPFCIMQDSLHVPHSQCDICQQRR